jgi:hypothetical protein
MALVGAAALLSSAVGHAQQPTAAPGSAPAGSTGVNVGSLSCNEAGGTGFVFGSTKALGCIFTPTDRRTL